MALMTVACGVTAQPPTIGVVKVNGKGEWQLFSIQQLTSSDKVVVQYPGKANRSDCCVTVTLDGGKRKQADVVVTDEYGDQYVWSYKLKAPPVNINRPFIGIAIVDNSVHAQIHGVGDNLVHVETGEKELTINSCLGSEGVHVLARDGKKMNAHLYLNLGYSVKSTCTDDMLE